MPKKQSNFGFDVPRKVHADDPPIPEWREDKTRREEIKDMVAFAEGVRDTSLEAFKGLKDSGQLGKQERIIFRALNGSPPMTLQEISKKPDVQINAVAGRVNGLKKKGVVVESQKRVCRVTGRVVTPVRVNS